MKEEEEQNLLTGSSEDAVSCIKKRKSERSCSLWRGRRGPGWHRGRHQLLLEPDYMLLYRCITSIL